MAVRLLSGRRVAILAADGCEALEVLEPLRAMQCEDAHVDVISLAPGIIQGMYRHFPTTRVPVDRALGDTVLPDQYDCLLLPGGAIGADALRSDPRVRKLVFAMDEDEKPIAAIGHAASILISAGIVSGRRITGCPRVRDDILNAGAYWADQPVVIDGNLITSRGTHDLAEFDVAVIEHFSTRPGMISTETRRLLSRSRIA